MASPSSKTGLIAILIVVAVLLATYFYSNTRMPKQDGDNGHVSDSKTVAPTTAKTPLAAGSRSQHSTLAEQWRWQSLDRVVDNNTGDAAGAFEVASEYPFTAQSVHDALQAVKTDANDDLILDHDALIALDEALERIYNKLDNESLSELEDLIEDALPGKVGKQTARLVSDYQRFLRAKEEFNLIHESAAPDQQTVASLSQDQALYGELQDLRKIHLGEQTAESLFEVSDANASYMFETMKLELDSSISTEDKQLRMQELQQNLIDATDADNQE